MFDVWTFGRRSARKRPGWADESKGSVMKKLGSVSLMTSVALVGLMFGSAARAQIRGAVADYDAAMQTLLLDVTRAYADVRQAQSTSSPDGTSC